MKAYLIAAGLIVVAYIGGRYSAPDKVVTKIEYKEKEVDHVEKQVHKVTRITQTKEGAKTITITTDTGTRTDSTRDSTTSESSTTTSHQNLYHAAFLYGFERMSLTSPIYGAMISKDVIGPLSIGLFGFTNLSGGVTAGLNF